MGGGYPPTEFERLLNSAAVICGFRERLLHRMVSGCLEPLSTLITDGFEDPSEMTAFLVAELGAAGITDQEVQTYRPAIDHVVAAVRGRLKNRPFDRVLVQTRRLPREVLAVIRTDRGGVFDAWNLGSFTPVPKACAFVATAAAGSIGLLDFHPDPVPEEPTESRWYLEYLMSEDGMLDFDRA